MRSLKTSSFWTSFAAVLFFVSTSLATIEEGRFGLAENSGEWRQQELEQWLELRLAKDIARFVPEHMFNVYVTVTFKNQSNSVRRVTNVNLSKFGAVTSLVKVDGVRPHQGLFGKVSKLDVTVLVDDQVAESTVEGIRTLIHNQIPIIDGKRIHTNVVKMDRPGMGFAGWLKKFEGVFATGLITVIFCVFLFYLLQNVRFNVQWSVGPPKKVIHKQEAAREIHPAVPPVAALMGEVSDNDYTAPSSAVGSVVGETDHLWINTAQAVALRKIRAACLSLSFDERIELITKDKALGVVMVISLPKSHSEKILSQLNDGQRKDLTFENLKCDLKKIVAEVDRHVEAILSYKGVSRTLDERSMRVATYVEQVGPKWEDDVYSELIKKNELDLLVEAVHFAPPEEVLMHLDFQVLKSAWTHLSIADRAVIAHLPPDWIKMKVGGLVDRTNAKLVDSLLAEFSEIKKKNDNLQDVADASYKTLLNEVREAYRQSDGIKKELEPRLQAWLHKKTQGVLGEDPSRKSA